MQDGRSADELDPIRRQRVGGMQVVPDGFQLEVAAAVVLHRPACHEHGLQHQRRHRVAIRAELDLADAAHLGVAQVFLGEEMPQTRYHAVLGRGAGPLILQLNAPEAVGSRVVAVEVDVACVVAVVVAVGVARRHIQPLLLVQQPHHLPALYRHARLGLVRGIQAHLPREDVAEGVDVVLQKTVAGKGRVVAWLAVGLQVLVGDDARHQRQALAVAQRVAEVLDAEAGLHREPLLLALDVGDNDIMRGFVFVFLHAISVRHGTSIGHLPLGAHYPQRCQGCEQQDAHCSIDFRMIRDELGMSWGTLGMS
jgi:hypothetical protein